MALTPDTDQFSQFLRLAFLRSPNFLTGVSGWTINQDGSAEFNNLTIRGTFKGTNFIINSSGAFFYNGTPANGNLIASIASTSGTDQFGNNFNAGISSYSGLNTAILTGAALSLFSVVTQRATLSTSHFTVFNSSGATIYDVDLARAAQFLYADTGSAAQGRLVASQAQTSGTDQFGNTYDAGVTVYNAAVNAITQLLNGFLNVGTPGQMAGTGGATPGQVGLASGGNPGVVRVDSGLTATGDSDAFVDVRSKNAQSSISAVAQRNIQLAGPLALSSEGSSPAQLATALLYSDGNGIARCLIPVAGDTNQYFIAWSITAANAVPQTISSTSATTITGCTFAVGAGLYRFRARVTFSGGVAAGTANFSVTGPATSNAWINALFNMSSGTAGAGAQNASLGPLISPTLTTGQNVADIEGDVTFSASGTMALACAEGTAGDTVIIQHAHFWLYPIT